jgi:RNA polymerase sigma-70 factor (ECF subfamily)
MSPEERFDEIYRLHAAAVLAYARRRAPRELAEEVVAETFLVCWRRLDRVPDDALPWLYAVARRTLANQRRAAARTEPAAHEPVAVPAPDVSDPTLALAFAGLPEHDRELLALVAWESLSLREAAVALGCSTGSCRVRLHRARRRLARRLEELEEAPSPRALRPPKTEGAAP